MLDILTTSSGLIMIIFLGYFLKKKGKFSLEHKEFLTVILINICLPCVAISSFEEFVYDPAFFFAGILGLCMNFFALFIGYLFSKKDDPSGKAQKMILTGSYNIGMFTVPFITSFFSSTAVLTALIYDIGNAFMVLGASYAIASCVIYKQKGNPIPTVLRQMSKSFPCMVYLFMVILEVLQIDLPNFVYRWAETPAKATTFLGMLMIGIIIDFKVDKKELKDAFVVIGLRYALSGVAAAIMFFMLPASLEIRRGLVLALMSPISTSAMVYSQKLGGSPMQVGLISTMSLLISVVFMIAAPFIL